MNSGIVSTIVDKCKRCYSCIRECPAKAIRVINGQALILSERCISCGHCVKVCSQGAKQIRSDFDKVLYDFLPQKNTIAIVAPAFAASFPGNYHKVPTALRKAGFIKACETAFGADLVSQVYKKYVEENNDKLIISTPCPAVYNYIEKYFDELVPNLATIVSPMIAMGRYLKENYGNDTKVVFIGPCSAKKYEYIDEEVEGAIDAVLTFSELKDIFFKSDLNLDEMEESHFDPPHAFLGKSYPLSGGLLKSATISTDILAKDIIIVEGKSKVEDIINDLKEKKINSKIIDILFCEGCISGPAIDSDLNFYSKREKVIDFIVDTIQNVDKNVWKSEIYNSRELDLTRKFSSKNMRKPMPTEEKIRSILASSNKFSKKDELNCGACGYHTCREYAIAIAKGLAEEDMCLPFLIDKLQMAYTELKETQDQLNNAEKLASIGQLAAGVAHEINNPLGSIILFASMLKKDLEKKLNDYNSTEDLKMIIDEANRCKNIVSNLLNFARQGKLKIKEFPLSSIITDVIHAVKINPEFGNIEINVNNKLKSDLIEADEDQLKQVILNIVNNACEAMEESAEKRLDIILSKSESKVFIEICDTGEGIPEENLNKLFTPFFTTKRMGKGTGLGLAISYGIIKMHKGDITVKSEVGKGSTFTVKLPQKQKSKNFNLGDKDGIN